MSLKPLVGVLSLLAGLSLYLISVLTLSGAKTTIQLLDPVAYFIFASVFTANGLMAISGKKTILLSISSLAFAAYCAWKVFNEYRLTGDLGLNAIIFIAFGATALLIALFASISGKKR